IPFNETIEFDYNKIDSFIIYLCLDGQFEINYGAKETVNVVKGDTVLIPAALEEIILLPQSDVKILEIYID
ncbi:mannose-6-phosphate isomerase, partial [Bacteroidota bacterium]